MLWIIGFSLLILIALLIFFPFSDKINWHKNWRQQQNIELYHQQIAQQPSAQLADEFAQRLLADEQILTAETKRSAQFSRQPKQKWKFGAFLFLVTFGLISYFGLARFQQVKLGGQAQIQQQQKAQNASSEQKNDDYVLRIQNKLRQNPNNGDDWLELGQAYMLNNEFENAIVSYQNAARLQGEKPHILGLAASAMYYQAGQRITPMAQQLIEQALAQDKNETSSLSLLASDAFLHNDYQKALNYWQQLLDSERASLDRREIIRSMKFAEQLQQAKQNN